MIPTTIKHDGRYTSLRDLAAAQSTRVRGLADNSEGKVAILFAYENETYENWFTTGYFNSLRRAVSYSRAIFQNEDIEMNIFKSTKLFPNIRGVMLKDKRITLTMSGKVNIVEMRDGADARCEIFFTDHEKTAVINRTQLLIVADIYGPETEDWKGKPVALYGEEGTWFGKHTWGIRVDDKMTRSASKKAPKATKADNGQKPAKKVADRFTGTDDDFGDDYIDPEELELADMIMNSEYVDGELFSE